MEGEFTTSLPPNVNNALTGFVEKARSAFETFLARLYVDETARGRFLADPQGEAMKAGLTAKEIEAVAKIDRVGLDLFTKSLERKRRAK